MKIIKVICENTARPALKTYGFLRMRQITWSVKDAVNVFFAVVLVDVDLPYWTSKIEHMIAFTAIFSNVCTAHAQQLLFMFFRCKFRQCRSIHRPWLPVRVQNFGDLATFSVDLCVLYGVCPPYFYFRFVSPTGLESIPHASTPTSIISTKFEVDMTTHCRFIAFLSVDTSRDLVTLTFDLLTLSSCYALLCITTAQGQKVKGHKVTRRINRQQTTSNLDVDTWPTLPPSLKTLRLFVHELRVITVPLCLPLKMRTRPLRMRRVTWPVNGVSN